MEKIKDFLAISINGFSNVAFTIAIAVFSIFFLPFFLVLYIICWAGDRLQDKSKFRKDYYSTMEF